MIPSICGIFIYGWFAHELFLASVVLLIIRKIDKKGKLLELGAKANILVIFALVLAVWGSTQILNTSLIGYMLIRNIGLPVWSYYIIILVWEIIIVPLAYEVINKIPVVRFLVLGIEKK